MKKAKNKCNNPDLPLSMSNKYNIHNYYEKENSLRCNLCSNKIINPKFCSKCIDELLKNNNFCKICNSQITSNDIIASSLNKKNEEQQKNTAYKQIDNKVENYCNQCDLEFSDKDKEIHINHLIIPKLEVYEKKYIIKLIDEFRKGILKLEKELDEEKNKELKNLEKIYKSSEALKLTRSNNIPLDNIEDSSKKNINQLHEENKQESQYKFKLEKLIVEERYSLTILSIAKEPLQAQYIDELSIQGIIKPENEIEIIDKIEILKTERPDNEIEYIEELYIPRVEKEPLKIENADYLFIEVDNNLRNILRSKNYIIESDSLSIFSKNEKILEIGN